MIKLYALLPRRDGLTREQFSRHWSTVHREHALRIDRICRYVQAHGMRPGLPGLAEAEWDGVPEVWFSSLESALGQRTDPQYTEHAHLDEPNFIAMDRLRRLLAVHHVLRDPGEVTTQLLGFVCSRPRQGSAALGPALEAAAESALTTAGAAIAVAAPDAPGVPPFDGVLELWWPNATAARSGWDVDRGAVCAALHGVVAPECSRGFFCRELRIRV